MNLSEKGGGTLVCNIFLNISLETCCQYSLEVPWGGVSNEYPQHILYGEIKITPELSPNSLPNAKLHNTEVS